MTAARELRLGVVGFGRLVREFYLPALHALDGVQLVTVADPLPASRRAATACVPGVQVHDDHRALLERGDLDGLLVASPPSTHLDIWRDAAARSLSTFVEKPLVLSSQLGALDGVRDRGAIMVDFNRRFWPTYGRVRDLVREGVLGTPVHLEFLLHLDVLGWSTVTRHRLDPGEGGLLHDLGCHAIDLAVHVIGEEPTGVSADATGPRGASDHLHVRLGFPAGSTATCDIAYGARTREWLVVRGPKATARLAEPNLALHVEPTGGRASRLVAWSRDAAALGYRAVFRSQSIGRASIRGALAAFVHGLRTQTPFSPGFEDGARNARLVAAAGRSLPEWARSQHEPVKAT